MKNKYTRLKWIAVIIVTIILYLSAEPANAKNSARALTLPYQQEVSGIVSDPAGTPLPGVTVVVKGKNQGTTTDINGRYSLTIGPEEILVFSFIGFKTLEEPVNGRGDVWVEMEEDVNALQEVVINAGYYNTTERERTGNISRVSAEEIERQPVINPLAAMQGRMSGVHITQTTGVPGGGFDIQIRGRNSLRADGNDPLYIVDGVPYSSQTLGSNQVSGLILPGLGSSPLNNINPLDIASIEVLKDADATAIYGSRGANGVVLITTKRGKKGKVSLDINANIGFGKVTRTMDLMNTEQYLEMRREAFANDGFDELPANAYDINGTWDANRNTDWQEVLIGGTAETSDVQASLSGGNEQTQFLISGTYHKESTVFPGNYGYTRGALNSNINHRSTDDKFSISFSTIYSSDENDQIANDLTRESQLLPPNAPELYSEDGSLNWENSTWNNPLRLLEESFVSNSNSLLANTVLSYKVFSNLEIKSNFGFTRVGVKETRTAPSTVFNPAFGLGSDYSSLFHNISSNNSWIAEPQISWKPALNRNNSFNFLIGATFQKQNLEQLVQFANGFSSNNLITNLSAASRISILSNNKIEYAYQAVFGRINYNHHQKYIVNLTGRRDGSSRFGPENKFANFGAIGAAWIFSEEKFIQETLPFLSLGKIRTSYGLTGSDQIGDYQFLNTYSSGSQLYSGLTGLRPNRLFNPDFGWEKNLKFEAGLELGFVKDKIFLSTSYFQNRSSNQLVGIPLPGTTGFSSVQSNLDATVENTGLEISLRTVNFQNSTFYWNTNLNFTIPNNKLVSFPGIEGSTFVNQYIIGEPLDIRKVYNYTGIDPQTGVYQFEDVNDDGVISAPGDLQSFVRTSPEFFGGIANNLSYKNFELDFLFQFVRQKGLNYIFSGPRPGTRNNQPVAVLDRWQQTGDNASLQRYSNGTNRDAVNAYNLFRNSNGSLSDASFIRLKNISLTYKIPSFLGESVSGSIYLRGQNLLTFTNYQGADPENGGTSRLPPLKILTTGLQISF